MIHDMDRSGYFGASDSRYIVAKNRDTKSWKEWWSIKLGGKSSFEGNMYTNAGNMYEHPILKSISDNITLDRQIIYERLLLRVNYDGDMDGTIYEVKTHRSDKQFEVTKAYWQQAQTEMFCYKVMQEDLGLPEFNKLWIVSYGLLSSEYTAFQRIDPNRISFHPVLYDKSFVKGELIPNLKYLSKKLRKTLRQLEKPPEDIWEETDTTIAY